MQVQQPRSSHVQPNATTLRVGDRASYLTVINTPQMAHVYITHGLIIKIENQRATLRLPGGRAVKVFLKSLSPGRVTHDLSRALRRRSLRRRRRTL
ncbi:hypothetical protein [Pseudomonas sp. NA-150]|uniref:hypothetical protein n=1 Tax=Pseudomonas sp. NA-150 TaxID=3367525 RepID=UPI0037C7C0A1